jgi:mannose/fructose/N-acetylgalactosamine-specific phosphotransferase system component IIB
MAILLYRVDDRLIHGQVVVGWGAKVGLDFIVVVDDELSESVWEQELYRAGLPADIDARFVSVERGVEVIPKWTGNAERGFVLTRDIATMRRLAEREVLQGVEVNLGGLHDAPGRERVLPYLFLSDEDRADIKRLSRAEVSVSAQDVPSARKIKLNELIEPNSS